MVMNSTTLRRWLQWSLEGRYQWGYSSSSTGRYGNQSLYVHIYPPDTPRKLRRCAHLARIWLPISAVSTLGTASIVVTLIEVSLLTASIGPAVLLLLAWIALVQVAAPINSRLATSSAWKSLISPNLDDEIRFDQLHTTVYRLQQAERQVEGGEISQHEYHRRWSKAFAGL